MYDKTVLDLPEAQAAIQAIIEEALMDPANPVCAAVVDDRGDLVIKCSIDEVKELVSVSEGTATFDLTVVTTGGTTYTGTDSARVVGR